MSKKSCTRKEACAALEKLQNSFSAENLRNCMNNTEAANILKLWAGEVT